MVIKACKADPATEKLIKVLRDDYSIEESKLDGGQYTLQGPASSERNLHWGANDGCSTYTEVLTPALRLATDQCLNEQEPSLLKYLREDHDITIPWIAFQIGGEINEVGYNITLGEINDLRNDFIEDSEGMSATEYQCGLAKRIFEEFMPTSDSNLDPDLVTWKLYTAMHIAGLEVSFSLIPIDPLGKSTPLHIALSVHTDDGKAVTIDPTYNAFDMTCLPSIEIDEAQALSIHYTQQALKAKDAEPLLDKALHIDPYNTEAKMLGWHVGKDIDYPLATMQSMRQLNRMRAKKKIEAK